MGKVLWSCLRTIYENKGKTREGNAVYLFCFISVSETNRLLLHSSLLHLGLASNGLGDKGGLGSGDLGLSDLVLMLLSGSGFVGLWLWGSSLDLEVLEGETNNGLLDALSSSGSLACVSLGLSLLVHLSPCLSPLELNWSDSLSEQRSGLVTNEEMDLSILSNEALASSWVHTVLSELAGFSLDNHYTNTKYEVKTS